MRPSILQAATLLVALVSANPVNPLYPIPDTKPQERKTKHLRPVLERATVEKRAETPLQPVVGTKGAPILVPENHLMDSQNPDGLQTNPTDAGLVANLKWSFSLSSMNLQEGGFVREQVVTDLPTSKDFSAAQNHVAQGAIRQMHWHDINEWGYVTAGSILVGAVSDAGKNQVFRANKGDIWFFPKGQGHVIQGLSSPGAEYLLVFDNGDFDAKGRTFNVDDWLIHTPLSVLAKNFGVPESTFKTLPKAAGSIQKGNVSDGSILSPNGKLEGESSYHYRASEKTWTEAEGGKYLKVDSTVFPISKALAAQLVEVKPGAMREMHWHPNGAEWLYFIDGQARATVWLGNGHARTFDFSAGDTAVFPDNAGHYIENTGNTTLSYMEIFKSDKVVDFSLQQWLALTPNDLVAQILNVTVETVKGFKTSKGVIVMGK